MASLWRIVMTEKQLEKGQRIFKEIRSLYEAIGRWENLAEIVSINIRYNYTYNSTKESEEREVLNHIDISKLQKEIVSNLKNKVKELQEDFKNL